MKIVDPIAHFHAEDLQESLVIRLGYSLARKEFELVISFADVQGLIAETLSSSAPKVPSVRPREFRQLLFVGSTKPRRERVLLKRCDPYRIDYALREDSGGGPVVQQVFLRKGKALRYSIELGFGSFGTYLLEFEEVTEHRRFGRAVAEGHNQWAYFDVESNQPIDFYDPFRS